MVASCFMKAGNLKRAISELEQIEAAFSHEERGAHAAYVQAQYYDKSGMAEKRDAALARILKAYTKKSQRKVHSRAHVWREKLGSAFTGAITEE